MSKSFCRFGLANGSVDDDAVSGNAIDDGELIINLDATVSIRFSAAGRGVGRSPCDRAADVVVVVVVVKFSNCWLSTFIVLVAILASVVAAGVHADVTGDVILLVMVVLFGCCVVDDVTINVVCTRSISGLMMASNKNDK